jgi:hypothetical protein
VCLCGRVSVFVLVSVSVLVRVSVLAVSEFDAGYCVR